MNKKITVMFAILLLSFITGLANAQGAPSGQEQSLGFDPFADEVVENSQNNSSTDLDPFAELELDPFSDGELDLTEQTPEPEKLSAKEQIEVLMSKFEKGEYSKKGLMTACDATKKQKVLPMCSILPMVTQRLPTLPWPDFNAKRVTDLRESIAERMNQC